jgi:membrane-bound inhibitor of C-type lysozyme
MVIKIIVGIVAFVVILRIGIFVLRALATPMPTPEEGEMRRVNLKYQCTICGVEVKMTKAGEDLPPPPRHCLEDMQLVAPVE